MKRAAPSPLKFLTPGQLVMCLVLFFLPWVEIQCATPKAGATAESFEKLMDPSNMVWTAAAQQSGIEIALGKLSFPDQQKQASNEKNLKGGQKSGPDGAPLLWLYLVAVLAGIGLGFGLSGKARKPALAGCCALALLVAGGQAAMGMPVMKGIEKLEEEMSGGAKKGNDKDKESLDDLIRLKYKFPFYLSMFLLVGGLATALLEPAATAPPPRERDGDDGDEDEPAPKKKPKKKR